ncbi:MAG: hypothetical protein KDK36_01915 [Leptospiraceae bacterium]|nr:hypothetical protein [Leptospiraceae bacterium]
MINSIDEFLSRLKNFEKTRNKNHFQNYTLNKFRETLNIFLENQGNKQKKTRISVVGTNGKGSVSFYLQNIALRSEYLLPIGLYTSPHLEHFTERININGKHIPIKWILDFLNSIEEEKLRLLEELSYFEFLTLLAMVYFDENKCNLEIYEAGLGGKLDATKESNPDFVVLTKVGYDHTEILGKKLETILNEKLLISTNNTKAIFSMDQDFSLYEIIEKFTEETNITLYKFSHKKLNYLDYNYFFANYILEKVSNIRGENKSFILEKNPPPLKGRMEVWKKDPITIFDVGHNPDAIYYLLNSMENSYGIEKWNIVVTTLKDKDIKGILDILVNWSHTNNVYRIHSDYFNDEVYENSKVIDIQVEEIHKVSLNSPTLICGGFRIYGILKKYFGNQS